MKTHVIFGVSVLVLIIAFVFGSSYYKRKKAEKIGFMAQAGVNIEQFRQRQTAPDFRLETAAAADPVRA